MNTGEQLVSLHQGGKQGMKSDTSSWSGGSPDHHGLTSLEIRTFLANLATPMFCLPGVDLAQYSLGTPLRGTLGRTPLLWAMPPKQLTSHWRTRDCLKACVITDTFCKACECFVC